MTLLCRYESGPAARTPQPGHLDVVNTLDAGDRIAGRKLEKNPGQNA